MRTWLYNRIDALLAMRVFSSGSGDDPSMRPFAVLSMEVEQPFLGMPTEARVAGIPFTVWLHDSPGSMLAVDDAAVALKNGLPTVDGAVVGGLSVLGVKWESTGADAADDHYGTNTRPVRFSMTIRR